MSAKPMPLQGFPSAAGPRRDSALDELLQPAQRLVPLPGDGPQRLPSLLQLVRPELPQALAPSPAAADEAGAGQDSQMFRDRLPGHRRTRRESSDGSGASGAQSEDEVQARLVSQRSEDGCEPFQRGILTHR